MDMSDPKNSLFELGSEAVSAEVGVLGSMLIDEAAVGPMVLRLSEEDFLTPEGMCRSCRRSPAASGGRCTSWAATA